MTKVPVADQIRLGPAAAALKAKLPHKQWRQVVHAARKKGYTLESALDTSTPDALKERTAASLRKQAAKTVQKAYRPAALELSREQKRVNALDAKRASDNKAYEEWLASKTGVLDAQARAADSALLDRQREIAQQSDQAWTDAQTAANQNAVAQPGRVSGAPSASLNLSAAAQHAAGQVANQRDVTAQLVGTNESAVALANASLTAGAHAADAKRISDTQAATSKIGDERIKLRASKIGDKVKEISRLLDNETTKAQNNRDYAAAAAKLGLDQKKTKFDMAQTLRDYGLKVHQLNLDKWKEDNAQAWKQAQLDLNYDQLKNQQGKAAADRRVRKWIARYNANHHVKPKDAGPSATETGNARKQYQTVQTALGLMNDLNDAYPKGYVVRKNKAGDTVTLKFREKLRRQGFDDVTIDIVNDLRAHGGKLSPAGYQKAQNLGIAHFYQRA